MNQYAPIALFVYARPEHTRQTLEALAANPEAKDSLLYVFADGPPEGASDETLKAVDEVRRVIRERQWCGRVVILESVRNLGLANSIVSGVTRLCEEHGKAIVLEDDIVTSPHFLSFMNEALELFALETRIFQISGFMVPFAGAKHLPPSGFFRAPGSWGWATWKRAWQHYSDDSALLVKGVAAHSPNRFDIEGSYPHLETLRRNIRGEIRTWAVHWYASLFLRDGLCLYPRQSLVRNIGFDGSGVHCGEDSKKTYAKLPIHIRATIEKPVIIEETESYSNAFRTFYSMRFSPQKVSLYRRVASAIKRRVIGTQLQK